MGMTQLAARRATRTVHVLVVEVPGHWETRVQVEARVRERGWRRAVSPADADALVVCGDPVGDLAEAVDRVWDQLPGPRVRTGVSRPRDAVPMLDRVAVDLLDVDALVEDARSRPTAPETERGDMDHGDMDHGDMDHGDMDHGDMDHGDMDMAPGGIALAEGAPDRDGLEMDELHLPLGPVLAYWPAGLVLRCTLHGDVIASAEVEQLGAGTGGPPDEQASAPAARSLPQAAVRLDNAARVLALAGWQDAATRTELLRDAVLAGRPTTEVAPDVQALQRKVSRSRLLRWSLRGVRPVAEQERADAGWPDRWAGDVHDRLLAVLDRATSMLAGAGREGPTGDRPGTEAGAAMPGTPDAPDLHKALPKLVTGLDLATARLVVASLDLEPIAVPEVAHA